MYTDGTNIYGQDMGFGGTKLGKNLNITPQLPVGRSTGAGLLLQSFFNTPWGNKNTTPRYFL
jgi:hypothetical protein